MCVCVCVVNFVFCVLLLCACVSFCLFLVFSFFSFFFTISFPLVLCCIPFWDSYDLHLPSTSFDLQRRVPESSRQEIFRVKASPQLLQCVERSSAAKPTTHSQFFEPVASPASSVLFSCQSVQLTGNFSISTFLSFVQKLIELRRKKLSTQSPTRPPARHSLFSNLCLCLLLLIQPDIYT